VNPWTLRDVISQIADKKVLTYRDDQLTLGSEQDAVDLLGDAFGEHADIVVVPADRVAPDFYTLSTRVAGEVVRKFAMYHIRLVVLGDVTEHLEASDAFRAFVHEINRGKDIWFVADEAELTAKLTGRT
jgi:hypothetical protein